MYSTRSPREPVEDLDEEQGDEHDDELDVELVAEDGHGEAGLHDGVLSALVQALDLRLAKLTEEDGLEQVAEAQREREREVSSMTTTESLDVDR